MTRDDILRMAREAGAYEPTNEDDWAFELVDLERFAALVAAAEAAKWVKGAKISIPTMAMEQEFSNYHRLGYKAGVAAEREACAKLCEEFDCENPYIGQARAVAFEIRQRNCK